MRLCLVLNFVTLVLLSTAAEAKPHSDAPDTNGPSTGAGAQPSAEKNENLAITPAPPISKDTENPELDRTFSKANYYYPYRKSLNLHIGTVMGFNDSSDDDDFLNLLIGFSRQLPRDGVWQWELGADFSAVGHGHLMVMRRRIYQATNAYRPYFRFGLMHKLVPDDKMASFSNDENYLARFGIGLEDIVKPPRSVRMALEIAAGPEDFLGFFTYGYSWGW